MLEEMVPTTPAEPERYELYENPAYSFHLGRREFFKALGGGIVVLFALETDESAAAAAQAGESGGGGRQQRRETPRQIAAWLHIGESEIVTVFTGKVEVGQDIRTSLAQAVAEELHVPIAALRLVMADTDLTPYDAGTFGSRTTPVMGAQLRRVAAAARETLLDLVVQKEAVPRDSLTVASGKVTDTRTGKTWTFGQIARGEALTREIGEDTATTPASAWKIAGTSVPKVDGRAVVTGQRRYTSDLKRPGMLHGKALRPPTFKTALVALDTKAAQALPGVTIVRDGDFVGVVAPTEPLAERALYALRAEWGKPEPMPSGDAALYDYLRKTPPPPDARQGRGGGMRHTEGTLETGWAAAKHRLSGTFTVAFIAHAPLEPRAAIAEWGGGSDGRLTVWTGTQRPFGVRGELAAAFRLPEDRIRVIVPDTGSGYGGKHTGEAAIEAARLAKAAGKPVRLLWTREEEFTWAYFRPGGVIEASAGVTGDGEITAWEYHNYNSGTAGIRTLYTIPHQHIEFHPAQSPLRQGSYRALASTANHFVRETLMDEMARAVAMDPIAFRRKNLKDARMLAVLDAAAARFGWDRRAAAEPGRGFGIAGGFEKGGYVATCAQVFVDKASGRVTVERLVTAFECGAVVNPDNLKNQVEGGVLMGLGGALFEAVTLENNMIQNAAFSTYRVPRFSDIPAMEVALLDRKDLPSVGAGESPIVAVAPAIGNALFDATGTRLRTLPLTRNGVLSGIA